MPTEEGGSKTSLPIKLVIKGKGYEISIEGELTSIHRELDALLAFQKDIAERFEPVEEIEAEEIPTEEEIAATPTADIPTIKPVSSNMDNLRSLFATPWGKTPRTVPEVLKALEVNAIYDRPAAISTYLIRLVKRGELRRIEKEGKWAYFQIPR